MNHPIYIPSKGRANSCKTADLLEESALNFSIVVEQDDVAAYSEKYPKQTILTLPQSSQGIAFARAWIKEYSTRIGESHHWQLDDDVTTFQIRKINKNIDMPAAEVIGEAERRIYGFDNIGIMGLRHSMYAWSSEPQASYNQQCCSCFLVNNKVQSNFRMGIVEDTDFSLQVLMEGWCTILFNRLIYSPMPEGKTEGGNMASGHYENILNLQKELIREWPNMFKIIIKNKRPRIHSCGVWSLFSQRPRSHKEEKI